MKTLSLAALLFASLMYAQTPATAPSSATAPSAAPATPEGSPAATSPAAAAPATSAAGSSATATSAASTAPANSPAASPAAGPQKVMLMFSATDAAGNPVANLSKGGVAISDNGRPVALSELRAMPDLPIDMGIILLGSMDFAQQQNAAIELAKILRPGKDRAFVMVAGGNKAAKAELPWLSDQAQLITQIKNLDKHVGYPDPFEFNVNRNAAGMARDTTQNFSGDTTSFFDFAWQNFQASPRFARRVLVVFRTPMGHAPGMSPRVNEISQLRQMHVVQGSQFFRSPIFIIAIDDVAKYLSGPKDIGATYHPMNSGSGEGAAMASQDRGMERIIDQQYNAGRTNLNELAANSGGRVWWDPKRDFAEAISGIKAELAVPYVASYICNAPAEVHNIKVSAGNEVRVAVQQTVYQQLPK